MSSDDVKITEHEDGSMSITDSVGTGALYAHEVAALRAHFAAERMPEDVQELVAEARGIARSLRLFQPRPGEWASGGVHDNDRKAGVVDALADALEAAYSQKGAGDEPR